MCSYDCQETDMFLCDCSVRQRIADPTSIASFLSLCTNNVVPAFSFLFFLFKKNSFKNLHVISCFSAVCDYRPVSSCVTMIAKPSPIRIYCCFYFIYKILLKFQHLTCHVTQFLQISLRSVSTLADISLVDFNKRRIKSLCVCLFVLCSFVYVLGKSASC